MENRLLKQTTSLLRRCVANWAKRLIVIGIFIIAVYTIVVNTIIPFPLFYFQVIFHGDEPVFKRLAQGDLVTYQMEFPDSSWVRLHYQPSFEFLSKMYHGGIYLLTSDGRRRKYTCDYHPCYFELGFEDEEIGVCINRRKSVKDCTMRDFDEAVTSCRGSPCFVEGDMDAYSDEPESFDHLMERIRRSVQLDTSDWIRSMLQEY